MLSHRHVGVMAVFLGRETSTASLEHTIITQETRSRALIFKSTDIYETLYFSSFKISLKNKFIYVVYVVEKDVRSSGYGSRWVG